MRLLLIFLVSLSMLYSRHAISEIHLTQLDSEHPRYKLRLISFQKCLSIPASDYVTGLLGNGAGHHTYFKRGNCWFYLARDERLPELCEGVLERKSLFFDGSAISNENCYTQVQKRVAEDQERAVKLINARGRLIRDGNITGIIVHDQVTYSQSLIIKADLVRIQWPYYQLAVEFRDAEAQPLAALAFSPFGGAAESGIFLLNVGTLQQQLASRTLDQISKISLRALLIDNENSVFVHQYINSGELDRFDIDLADFNQIPQLGTVKHSQWIKLLELSDISEAAFDSYLQELLPVKP